MFLRRLSPQVRAVFGERSSPNAGRDYKSCHDKMSRVDFLVGLMAGECRREYMVLRVQTSLPDENSETLASRCRQSEFLRRMREELHLICGFPVRVRAALSGAVAQMDRATERFSTDCRRRLEEGV